MLVRVLNVDKLVKKLGKIENLDLSKSLKASTALAQRNIKKITPVNKNPNAPTRGNLRASIRRSPLTGGYKQGGSVHTNVHYAPYVEFGTRYMDAQPYMTRGLKESESEIQKMIIADAKSQIKQVTK